ncbi:MAG TPA: aspartate aminotransferase family protein [Xanthobacteraceae bacterium]|nr:aspartate aminotransferase family protein [Xanthobacteraceae bacterium]
MSRDLADLFTRHERERYAMHARHLNEQMVKVLRAIGYDIGFCRGEGAYLYDRDGVRYLDLLSGFGVFAIGRNHPVLRDALKSVLDGELPNLVQMDVSPLAGILAERLLARVPYLDKVFFTNSGTETVEAAIKFARAATGRTGIVYCEHAFHGLSYGALSLNGDEVFRKGFEPLLPDCVAIPFNDLPALEKALRFRTTAAFIVEPIQGKGVNLPADDYLKGAAKLCRRYGTLFVADEIQTGLGRTGRFLAIEHWNVEPDMVLISKSLSGGHVPVGALLTRQDVFEKMFNRMDRAVVHGSTFAKNDLAMAAGIATLDVLDSEKLIENAARMGERLLRGFEAMRERYELVREIRGKGLMIGIEFGAPKSLKLKSSWNLIEAANKGLFCQLITIPLLKDHKILCQVAGHGSHTVKLLPPLVISEADCDWILSAFDSVIADSHRVPGAIWSLGKTLAGHAMRAGR